MHSCVSRWCCSGCRPIAFDVYKNAVRCFAALATVRCHSNLLHIFWDLWNRYNSHSCFTLAVVDACSYAYRDMCLNAQHLSRSLWQSASDWGTSQWKPCINKLQAKKQNKYINKGCQIGDSCQRMQFPCIGLINCASPLQNGMGWGSRLLQAKGIKQRKPDICAGIKSYI